MANSRMLAKWIGGTLAAAAVIFSLADTDALARKKKRRGKSLTVQRINVANASDVPANQIIEIVFSTNLDQSTVTHSVIQLRGENATQTGFTKAVFSTFQLKGRTVRIFPRLPTHLRNPASASGDFYPEGAAADNAVENGGLQANTGYELRIQGKDSIFPVRSKRGRPLGKTVATEFSTAAAADPASLYTTTTYLDSPPPQFAFSNPPDKTPQVTEQYALRGGASDVPNDLSLSMFCTKVPLSPTTLRILGNVEFEILERKGNTGARRPIDGSVFVEQNFATTHVVFKPRFPLADVGIYAMRVSKNVKDLTEQFDFQPSRERERLRAIYEWLAQDRSDNPGASFSELADPPADLIPDWPSVENVAERAILKENILALGDTYPDEIDPRVMILFSTRDEPVTDAEFIIEFNRADGLFDGKISTAEWDVGSPSAASAILTIAGGSAADGDFFPTGNTTLDLDTFQGQVANFRDVVIPQGVTVTLVGSIPIQFRAINFTLNGTLESSGFDGTDARKSSYANGTPHPQNKGGDGGPGGGKGADSSKFYSYTPNTTIGVGNTGTPGNDAEGVVAEPEDGGRGGMGGTMGTGSYYRFGGGGGGGGARTAGSNGAPNVSFSVGWGGGGGQGGAGSTNDDLDPLVGGAGAGSGGNSAQGANGWSWNKTAGAGAGGGGAVQVQVARLLIINTSGVMRAPGGEGGDGTGSNSTLNAGPGGGGGAGSYLLRSGSGFQIADPANALDMSGGPGGTDTGTYTAPNGGAGGDGYRRLEDPNGGLVIPGSTAGVFDPIGGGVASVVYSKFADLGVEGPRILNFTNDDLGTDPTLNDAVYIEMQMTREHPTLFGVADVSAIDGNQDTVDPDVTSEWYPVKIHDNTDVPTGAFSVPGWNKGAQGNEVVFAVDELNERGYRFVRYRIWFQLDSAHARTDPIPSVDFIILHFQFNF